MSGMFLIPTFASLNDSRLRKGSKQAEYIYVYILYEINDND